MKKFTRIQTLTEKEQQELKHITQTTRGFSHYGNRARGGLMLPLETAKFIAEQASKKGKSPNEILNDIISAYIEIMKGE